MKNYKLVILKENNIKDYYQNLMNICIYYQVGLKKKNTKMF